MPVGIRELKSHLSEYVSRAARGEEVIVTDRNRPVARLVPYTEASNIDLGIEEGWIEAPRRTKLGEISRASAEQSTLDVLDDDRG